MVSSACTAEDSQTWESQKENAAPLERGRRVASFGVRQPDPKDLKQKITYHESLVRPSEPTNVTKIEGDPLVYWLSYIKFCQDSFPANTRQSFLIMERCVRALVKMEQYSNDDRFVGVCAKYADKTKEPGAIFKYLHQQKVGSRTALFWIAWAFVAEKDNDFPFAEQVFKKGISKNAKPLHMLKVRHKQFQRRMSRHWLNSSKMNDHLNDEYEDNEPQNMLRSTLGGISRDRLDRNDRSRSSRRVQHNLTRRNNTTIPNSNGKNSSVNNDGAFSIFVESEGENAYLDQSFAENDRSVIARDSERKKENTLDAERWNERGGLQASLVNKSSRSKGPLPAFSVFVDEECANYNERQELEHGQQMDRQRQVRDERTFRERPSEGMTEKIIRDPVRYLRDPSQIEPEIVADSSVSQRRGKRHEAKEKVERKNRAGFNKRLLKNRKGEEQCFEEARAKMGSYALITGTSKDFNLLQIMRKTDQSSQMDLDIDEEEFMDVSMSESLSKSVQPCDTKFIKKEVSENNSFEKRLFQNPDVSFGTGLNQTAISNASSTLNEINNAGLPRKHEEETINTKFAMRELSMMFSSPTFEVNNDRRRQDQSSTSRINESLYHGNVENNTSFGNVGDGIMLNNSICNTGTDNVQCGENSFAKSNLYEDYKISPSEKFREVNKKKFAIFEDEASLKEDQLRPSTQTCTGFQIYDEGNEGALEENNVDEDREEGFLGKGKRRACTSLHIYDEQNSGSKEDPTKRSARKFHENQHRSNLFETGDTASISDAIALLEDEKEFSDQKTGDVDGETANLSLFNEILRDESYQESKYKNKLFVEDARHNNPGNSFQVEKLNKNNDHSLAIKEASSKRLKSSSNSNVRKIILVYAKYLNHNIHTSLRRLQTKSDVISDSNAPLLSIISSKGKAFYLPNTVLPQQLRRKRISNTDKVALGKHGGLRLKKELGEGAFGRVILANMSESCERNTIAIKIQRPTGCLAWEYIVLQRLERRLVNGRQETSEYAFPRPLSFISMADGGILSMSAASESGLNLVDLCNFYKLKLNMPVPELIALHYVSVAIGIIEKLHWYGGILHCDIKPDNFVLSSFVCPGNRLHEIGFSNLTLVDFGRAVDLADGSDFPTEHARNTMFSGTTAKKTMQCVAMRNGESWSYDVDTYGICDCAYVLLFGKDLKIEKGKGGRWQQSEKLKRYWNKDIWNEVFDSLLNLDEVSGSAIDSRALSLRRLRGKIDKYLEIDSKLLHELLYHQANNIPDSREKIK